MVLAAGRKGGDESHKALAELCEMYWYPLYGFVRRRGLGPDEAQDAVQEFFTRLLERETLGRADRGRGRFRSFLLASLENFLANRRRHERAKKRGGGRAALSFDFAAAESRLGLEPAHDATPDRLYERRWAMTLLERVLARLRDEYAAAGNAALFEQLAAHLAGEADARGYAEVAAALGMSEGAVKVAAHRLRRKYRERLRAEVAQTVADPADVDDELRALLHAVAM